MPSPNRLKEYISDSYYHIYNRGINKMNIFERETDYQRFLLYLHLVLAPTGLLMKNRDHLLETGGDEYQIRQLDNAIQKGLKYNLDKEIDLMAFCLMPNHFHLVVYQREKRGIEILMRRIASGYTKYFNGKCKRHGTLFENRYKAGHLHYEPRLQVLFTARYVDRNNQASEYPYSSLRYYKKDFQGKKPAWLNTKKLQDIFRQIKSKPNGIIEDEVARFDSYYEFVKGDVNADLEDVRLFSSW